MTALPSCDPAAMAADLEAPGDPRDAATWLGRRAHHFGASEAHALLVICGKRSVETCPAWMRDELVKETRTRLGAMPMLIARKVGLRRPQTAKRVTTLGTQRERELLEAFRIEHAASLMIDPDSIMHGSAAPQEWYPLPDRHCPQLACSPDDGWGRDALDGSLVVLEEKCSYESYLRRYGGLPEYYLSQLTVRMAIEGAARAVLIEGTCWSNDRVADGPVVTYEAGLDVALLAEIRACAREQWERVEELRRRMGT
jgi:hypothetical protein